MLFYGNNRFMNKFYLMKNPKLFQGEEYIKNNDYYFEGWYFKNSSNNNGISFIPGISINYNEKKAFIQVITNESSYFINYDISEFMYSFNPFYIKIGKNYFSQEEIKIDLYDQSKEIEINGTLKYSNTKNIKTNCINPNIMGPFSYVPNMECNHAIISMKNNIEGTIKINNKNYNFNNANGYIEKDWGTSFPKSYIWCQGNSFEKSDASFMLSIAEVPLRMITFKGLICVFIIGNKEYKFTTYNNSKIVKCDITNKNINIIIKKGKYKLNIYSRLERGQKLFAPKNGQMTSNVFENILANIKLTLTKRDTVIFSDSSNNCGIEIFNL